MKENRPLYFIVGTRAQLIKVAPVMRSLDARGIPYMYVFSGQHTETIDDLERSFGLRRPDVDLSDGMEANTRHRFLKWAARMFGYLFRPGRVLTKGKGVVINHGDTATCAWGTLLGKLHGSTTAHLESGLRSFNIFHPFPEELQRLFTFFFTDIYFCPNEWAMGNLKRYRGEKINTQGNTLMDSVALAKATETNPLQSEKPYVVFSMHRFENLFTADRLEKNIEVLEKVATFFPTYFVLHPVTREVLKKNGILKKLAGNDRIRLTERYNFIDFINVIDGSEFMVTDGGSNQEEASYLGVPTLLLRASTERIEGLGENIVLSKYDGRIIDAFLDEYKAFRRVQREISESPSQIITDTIIRRL